MLERGPDEEGIETVESGNSLVALRELERGPDEEGIETGEAESPACRQRSLERGPDEEGIETGGLRHGHSEVRLERGPDQEGIKTLKRAPFYCRLPVRTQTRPRRDSHAPTTPLWDAEPVRTGTSRTNDPDKLRPRHSLPPVFEGGRDEEAIQTAGACRLREPGCRQNADLTNQGLPQERGRMAQAVSN